MSRPTVPVCVEHRREMRPTLNGHLVQLNYADGNPYEIWAGDEYTCPVGGERVVVGFASAPVARAHEPGFAQVLPRVRTAIA